MKDFNVAEIGTNAGRLWRELEKRTSEISIHELCIKLSMTFEDLSLSVGWLAREKNVVIYKKDGRLLLAKVNSDFSWG